MDIGIAPSDSTTTTTTGGCAHVETSLGISLLPTADTTASRLSLLEEVSAFVDILNDRHNGTLRVFLDGPTVVQTAIVLQLAVGGTRASPARIMNAMEIDILQQTLLDLFLTTTTRNETRVNNDIVVTTVLVYLQELRGTGNRRRYLQQEDMNNNNNNNNNTNAVNDNEDMVNDVSIVVRGTCNGCPREQFGGFVNDAVDENTDMLEDNLEMNGAANGTDYFSNTTVVGVIDDNNNNNGTTTVVIVSDPNGLDSFERTNASSAATARRYLFWMTGVIVTTVVGLTTVFCCWGTKARRNKQAYLEGERQKYLQQRQKYLQKQRQQQSRRWSRVWFNGNDHDSSGNMNVVPSSNSGSSRRMQVLPSVAASRSVGHSDVTSLHRNF